MGGCWRWGVAVIASRGRGCGHIAACVRAGVVMVVVTLQVLGAGVIVVVTPVVVVVASQHACMHAGTGVITIVVVTIYAGDGGCASVRACWRWDHCRRW